MRPHQWIKNGFVLAALIFSQHLLEPDYVLRSLLAFATFCLLSSSVYAFNDILDLKKDRLHPIKRTRPLAAGQVSVQMALFSSQAWASQRSSVKVLPCGYWPILFFRVAGAAVIEVDISPWLILCTLLVALFLGFAKRRHEIVLLEELAGSHREILQEYSVPYLDQLISIVTASTIVAYSIYTMSPEVIDRLGNRYMVLTLPLVIYGIFRYLYLVHMRRGGGSAARALLADGPLLGSVFLWGLAVVTIVYFL
jgi:4-hydroxybenzoate polyprenyltransferase